MSPRLTVNRKSAETSLPPAFDRWVKCSPSCLIALLCFATGNGSGYLLWNTPDKEPNSNSKLTSVQHRTVELNVMRSELYLFEMSVSLMEKGSVSSWDVSKVTVEQLTDRQCDSCGSILFYLHQMSLVPFATENNRRRIQTVIIGGSGSSSLCRWNGFLSRQWGTW